MRNTTSLDAKIGVARHLAIEMSKTRAQCREAFPDMALNDTDALTNHNIGRAFEEHYASKPNASYRRIYNRCSNGAFKDIARMVREIMRHTRGLRAERTKCVWCGETVDKSWGWIRWAKQ